MLLIDSHCHLYLPEFQNDIDGVIQRAKDKGVGKFFLPNIDSTTKADLLKLTSRHSDCCYPMMGLHPTSVKANFSEELEMVESELKTGIYKAVGEIGIDLYWDKTFAGEQKIAFLKQLNWAKLYKLPVVIHARESFKEIFEIVDSVNDETLTGIFHCFTGTMEDAARIISYKGFKIGIGGVVTFKNGGLDKILNDIPIEHIVLETDSPYLSPAPYRGKRNESAYLWEILNRISQIYNLGPEEVAEITSYNSLSIFKMI